MWCNFKPKWHYSHICWTYWFELSTTSMPLWEICTPQSSYGQQTTLDCKYPAQSLWRTYLKHQKINRITTSDTKALQHDWPIHWAKIRHLPETKLYIQQRSNQNARGVTTCRPSRSVIKRTQFQQRLLFDSPRPYQGFSPRYFHPHCFWILHFEAEPTWRFAELERPCASDARKLGRRRRGAGTFSTGAAFNLLSPTRTPSPHTQSNAKLN